MSKFLKFLRKIFKTLINYTEMPVPVNLAMNIFRHCPNRRGHSRHSPTSRIHPSIRANNATNPNRWHRLRRLSGLLHCLGVGCHWSSDDRRRLHSNHPNHRDNVHVRRHHWRRHHQQHGGDEQLWRTQSELRQNGIIQF